MGLAIDGGTVRWTVGEDRVEGPEALRSLLTKAVALDDDLVVTLATCGRVRYGTFVAAVSAIRRAGVRHLWFAGRTE